MSEIIEKKDYHENKNLWKHFFLKDGKLHGEYKTYYTNGNIAIHTYYKDDKENGERKSYYSDGVMYLHCFYKDGKEISLEEYIKENNLSTKNILKLV